MKTIYLHKKITKLFNLFDNFIIIIISSRISKFLQWPVTKFRFYERYILNQ